MIEDTREVQIRKIGFKNKVTGFMTSPKRTFQAVEQESSWSAFYYYMIWTLISATLTIIILTVLREESRTYIQIAGFNAPIPLLMFGWLIGQMIASALVGGTIAHCLVYFWGKKRPYQMPNIWMYGTSLGERWGQTLKIWMYGVTPSLVLGWLKALVVCIPNLYGMMIVSGAWGVIVSVWSVIVIVIGLKELHRISMERALVIVILAIIISVLIGGVIM